MDTQVKNKLLWASLLSIGFTVFLLLRIEWNHFNRIANRLDIIKLIIAYGIFLIANLVRAFRFRTLDHMNIALSHWWNINAFYNFITATLPGGAGEAASAYILKRFAKFNILGAFRMLLLSRFMDMLALSALFFFAAVQIGNKAPYQHAAVLLSGILFVISLIALIPASELFVMKLLQKIPAGNTFIDRVSEKLSELIKISKQHRNSNAFGITLLQSGIMMTGAIISTHLALRSMGVDFTLVQSFYCFGIYAIFQIFPVQGIAGIGTQAAWWALALNASGYSNPDAIALGFVLHGIFYVFIIILAMTSSLRWQTVKKT